MNLTRIRMRVPLRRAVTAPSSLLALLALLAGCEDTVHSPRPHPLPPEEPFVIIEQPAASTGMPRYAKVTRFTWRSGRETPPDGTRWLWHEIVDTNGVYNPGFDIIANLNANLERYDDWWSPWRSFAAPNDSGRTTIIGDDETVRAGRFYIFAAQAAGGDDAVSTTFGTDLNVRLYRAQSSPGPLLTVTEPLLGRFNFIGQSQNPVTVPAPPGIELTFRWTADAGAYAGEVTGYRYGWDILDTDLWDAPYRPDLTSTHAAAFSSGLHTLTVEAVDLGGTVTRAAVAVETVPFPMERNLLWVDDFPGGAVQSPLYEMPSEDNHSAFWLEICARADGFEPSRDVYVCREQLQSPPGIAHIGLYKNIIWTYSSSSAAWETTVRFTPESDIDQGGTQTSILSIFLVKGGHLWTEGRADRSGGLAAVLVPTARSFPVHLACEIAGNREDCAGDRSGVRSLPHRDYCISMVDKVDGTIRQSDGMPYRATPHFDVMAYAYRDDGDIVTGRYAGLPARLDLRGEVTLPGRFFDPDSLDGIGGMPYVEVYDPAYWMIERSVPNQTCFHPLYRMRARDPASALDHGTVAVWITRYEETVPDAAAGIAVAAPSVHFGFPLWFFGPAAADSIAAVIFEEWGIQAYE
jgi:hypothetical protein